MSGHIHIIAFDNPYPPDYGGAIDVYFKLRAFKEAGIDITLHIFEYKRFNREVLERLCTKVCYYTRPISLRYQLSSLPFIVNTRRNSSLLHNLLEDNSPIFFEGLHTTLLLNHPALSQRKKIVRTHNIEHQYYSLLAQREKNRIKKCYYQIESYKLKRYEPILASATGLAAISQSDCDYFRKINPNTQLIGAFHPFSETESKTGFGKYMLYHGNLEVAENTEAVDFILTKIISGVKIPFVIAGKNPSEMLINRCKSYPDTKVIGNPSDEEMTQLISDAHIHLLPTFQPTGVKLKLLYALFAGRHVVVSPEMVIGSDLQQLCSVCQSPDEFIETIQAVSQIPFDENILRQRKAVLSEKYNNVTNIHQLSKLIFDK